MICTGFAEIRPHLDVQAPVTVTGNPVREEFETLHRRFHVAREAAPAGSSSRSAQPRRLVVLGGASGARSLNQAVPAALHKLGDRLRGWQIVHQTGEGQLQETESRYQQLGVPALAVASIDQIASVLFASDLVVCRAGGGTLAELALAGAPAVVVPYPAATDDHQTANARVFASAGACRVVEETAETDSLEGPLARELEPLLGDNSLRSDMTRNMLRLARPDATGEIARCLAGHCGLGTWRHAA
jgi:UDP-N-acetylglucosamine--N-acetylmuramyl-(pentapeptide) pyrophosphoryl-undecaprenol N-acetylglucosamine transferase